jgi:hypothetical protein
MAAAVAAEQDVKPMVMAMKSALLQRFISTHLRR